VSELANLGIYLSTSIYLSLQRRRLFVTVSRLSGAGQQVTITQLY